MVLLTTFKFSRYIILPTRGCIHVIFHDVADQRDICQAYLQACLLRRRIIQVGREGLCLSCRRQGMNLGLCPSFEFGSPL